MCAYGVESDGHEARLFQPEDSKLIIETNDDEFTYWEHYLGIDQDYDRAYEELAAWPNMADIVEFSDGIRIINQAFFETAITFILSQCNNIPRIKGIVGRICEGGPFPDAETLLVRIQANDLGLGYRQSYVEGFCKAVIAGWHLDASTCDEAITQLRAFEGIGEKVATCICLYGLGFMQAHPVDVWVQRALDEIEVTWHPGYAGLQQQLIYYWIRMRDGN